MIFQKLRPTMQLYLLSYILLCPSYLGGGLGRNEPEWRGFLRAVDLHLQPHCENHSRERPGGFGCRVGGRCFGLQGKRNVMKKNKKLKLKGILRSSD